MNEFMVDDRTEGEEYRATEREVMGRAREFTDLLNHEAPEDEPVLTVNNIEEAKEVLEIVNIYIEEVK